MRESKFIENGDRVLRESKGYRDELARIDKEFEELKNEMKGTTPLRKRELESRVKRLTAKRKSLCPKSALW